MNPCEEMRIFFLDKYRSKGGDESEKYLKFLLESLVSIMVFMSKYKQLEPIEKMPEREKTEMKMYVTKLLAGKTVEEKLVACKVLYTVGTLL